MGKAIDFLDSVFKGVKVDKSIRPVESEEDVNTLLASIGTKEAELQKMEGELNAEIHNLTQKYAVKANLLAGEIMTEKAKIEGFVTANKHQLFKEGSRSIQYPNGDVGFRKGSDRLYAPDDIAEEALCRKMQKIGMSDYVRDSPSLQKDRIKEDFDAKKEFQALGFRVTHGKDKFYVKPALTKLER